MQIAKSGVDYVSAPADYADLFRTYHEYVVILVRRAGIDPQQAEDVASDILLRFMERDSLNKFNPDLSFVFEGEVRPARFKSYLSKFVIVYVRGFRDKQLRQASRELLIIDQPAGAHAKDDDNTFLGDRIVVDGPEESVLAAMNETALIEQLRAYLSTIPKRSRFDTCNLVELFDAMVEQVHRTGAYSATELRMKFQVSSTAMHTWIKWLRTNIALYLKRPLPAPKPRAARRNPR